MESEGKGKARKEPDGSLRIQICYRLADSIEGVILLNSALFRYGLRI